MMRVTQECNRDDHDACQGGQCECPCHLAEPDQYDGTVCGNADVPKPSDRETE